MSGAVEFADGTVVSLSDIAERWVAFLDLMEPPEGPSVEPWYPGQSVDHIYPTCPGLRGSEPRVGRGALYPEAGDVCGWCLRVWRSRQ